MKKLVIIYSLEYYMSNKCVCDIVVINVSITVAYIVTFSLYFKTILYSKNLRNF